MSQFTRRDYILVCNCQRSMTIDGRALGLALGLDQPLAVHTDLCRGQIPVFEDALKTRLLLHIACTQEAPLFREIAEDKGHAGAALSFTNIRERAGWCEARGNVTAKMAALLAEAVHPQTPTGTTTLTSGGVCLVYGRGQAALDVAASLAGRLNVTVLLTDPDDALPPRVAAAAITRGRVRRVTGRLGAFELEVDGYAAALPSSRAKLEFALARDGARSTCDIIIDMAGGRAMFSAGERRDGYLRADPGDPAAIARIMLKATDLVGEFEKPLYVDYDPGICAHSRSAKVGCTKCLDVCPTGAITSAGDHVAIDHKICAGCGTCSAVCPTGAVNYAYPSRGDLIGRMQALLSTYAKAGGARPILLVHDEEHGGDLVAALARHGRGLPANVLPLSLYSVTEMGHEMIGAALVLGAEQVVLAGSPAHASEAVALAGEIALLDAILAGLGYAGQRIHFLSTGDPDVLGERLYDLGAVTAIKAEAFSASGSKRDIARTVLSKLHAAAPAPVPRITLPMGAPYGRIDVKIAGCTLCLACVGACPANALSDNPQSPQLSFTEAACVQCGVCVATCPEKVISLAPGFDFTPSALSPAVVKEEAPAHCVNCGKAFGTRSTIDKVLAKLKGRHAMFQNEAQLRLIQMCDTCRVVTVSEQGNDPYRVGERPRVRTTDDYLAEAKAEKAKGPKTPDDFLG